MMTEQEQRALEALDRLLDMAMAEAERLGYVLAHEIAHVLQRISRHSNSGIMKSKWDGRDYAEMRRISLGFSEEDVTLIRQGLLEGRIHASDQDR